MALVPVAEALGRPKVLPVVVDNVPHEPLDELAVNPCRSQILVSEQPREWSTGSVDAPDLRPLEVNPAR